MRAAGPPPGDSPLQLLSSAVQSSKGPGGVKAEEFKVTGQELENSNRRSVQMEEILQGQNQPTVDDSTFDFLKGKYIFRFPFLVTAINWGAGLGLVFGLHTYFRTRSLSNAMYWFFTGGVLTGMPIFGFFMFRYTFYSTSIKRFEREQSHMAEESDYRRAYLIKKLRVKNPNVTDEFLLQRLMEEKEHIIQKYSLISQILPEREF